MLNIDVHEINCSLLQYDLKESERHAEYFRGNKNVVDQQNAKDSLKGQDEHEEVLAKAGTQQ